MPEPVDAAMAAERPAKQAIRALWVAKVLEFDASFPDSMPLYLTLSGAEGRDLELLAESGVFERTEVGGVAAKDLKRLVAVESRPGAVIQLLRKFPGLRVKEQPVQNLVRNTSPTAWPEGEDEWVCRARVINLDLDEPLQAYELEGQIVFPLLTCVSKFSQLHAIPPQRDWVLYLTLYANLLGPSEAWRVVFEFLVENCRDEPEFATRCRNLFGNMFYEGIIVNRKLHVDELDREAQQKVLMAFVPKRIARMVVGQGWHVATTRNLRYGGTSGSAPMVTWIIEFRWDPQASGTPQSVYRESLRKVLVGSGQVAEDGTISQ